LKFSLYFVIELLKIILGGGGGAKLLGESSLVGEVLKKHEKEDKLIAAICAGL